MMESTQQPNGLTKLHRRLDGDRWTLAVMFLVLFTVVGTTIHYQQFRGSGLPPSMHINTHCRDRILQGAADLGECWLPPSHQFTKFVWFITDGFPYFLASKAMTSYDAHSIKYTTSVYGNKWSHTIYTSWFTGLPTTNLFGDSIFGDTLFSAMSRAPPLNSSQPNISPIAPRYIGPKWAPLVLMGGEEKVQKEYNFKKVVLVDEPVGEMPYPSLKTEELAAVLQEIAASGESLIAHSGLYDKSVHTGNKVLMESKAAYLHQYFTNPTVRRFIDTHPDYLLVLSSDHGKGQPGSKFHGDEHASQYPNNVGFVVFYNPGFEPQEPREIDVVDVLPTFTKYLRGVDIPFHSCGMAQNNYTTRDHSNDDKAHLHVIRQNARQLLNAVEYKKVLPTDQNYERILQRGDFNQLLEVAKKFKEMLYHPALPVYFFSMVFTALCALATGLFWLSTNNWNVPLNFLLFWPYLGLFGFPDWRFKKYLFEPGYFFLMLHVGFLLNNLLLSPQQRKLLFTGETLTAVVWTLGNTSMGIPNSFPALLSILGAILSWLEEYHLSGIQTLASNCLHALLVTYFATSRLPTEYYFAGFHPIALLLFVGIGISFIFGLVKRDHQCTITSVSCLLLLIRSGDLAVIVINYQFHHILPQLLSSKLNSSIFSYQASILYIIQIPFALFVTVWGEQFNWQVDPSRGAIGLEGWNTYPILSGFLMIFAKFGLFFFCFFHAARFIQSRIPIIVLLLEVMILALECHWIIAVYTSENHTLDGCLTMVCLQATNLVLLIYYDHFQHNSASMTLPNSSGKII